MLKTINRLPVTINQKVCSSYLFPFESSNTHDTIWLSLKCA
ncbi:MAG: hypothetical protein DLM72_12630 [Candidatus Nitrosopolaris wilkensis]|nr:MAG: hypothetical protein DLM72_12630 [Candidatus Nitrosopolaris wilkensis]